ncbi:Uncharacterized membrane protein YkvA, DUF1232 family [Marinobacter daqiaonensis]|uniref:Uncharacterized membrane protein YkvA, DUF1232 family n=1 Tax=Marinobacter daqiaonensis TaxID=650891 RepID=A0A1I6I6K9_9GAMM|nr:YkvA family protein [Marinobacter daqiaonensis]SFR62346.1 Uncharacterized membrane protein YkvA, DUF1232 family [Marinobacter daqiaonensis]
MTSITSKQAQEELDRESSNVDQADVETVLQRQKKIEEKVRSSGRLRRFSTDIKLMFSLLRDYLKGNYRTIPWKSIAAIAGALLYVLNPLDLIPDVLVGVGFIDDAGVVALCLAWVEDDLHRYAAWKELKEEGA